MTDQDTLISHAFQLFLVGLPAAGNVVTQALPAAVRAYDAP